MGLTGDILEQAKLQSGGINLLRKYFNLRELLEKVLTIPVSCKTAKIFCSGLTVRGVSRSMPMKTA
jgi:hypothetical protein